MQASNKTLAIRVSLLCLLLLVCLGVHASQSKTFPAPEATSTRFAAPYALKDWMPDNTYESILQHVSYYLAINNVRGRVLTLTTAPRYADDGSLSFEFHTNEDTAAYSVTVETTIYDGGISSNDVTVDGDSAAYAPASQLYGAHFNGFDSLTSSGLTAAQVYAIQQRLADFSDTGDFDIDTTRSVQQSITDDGATQTKIGLSINGRSYTLIVTSTEINNVQLRLIDNSDKQVFNTGVITIAN